VYNLDELLSDADARVRLADAVHAESLPGVLRSIKVKIISNCNLRCEMCKYWRIAKQSLPAPVLFSVLESAASLGCRKVHFSGGEVTLHPQLTEVIRHAAGLGMRVNLTSNGIRMDKQQAQDWIEAGLRSASFSLDGMDRKTHDAIRGVDGAYKRTLRAIRILRREIERRKTRLRIRVNMVLSRRNLSQLPGLIRLAGELGAVDVLPMPIDGMPELLPTEKEIRRFNAETVPEAHEQRRAWGMPCDADRLYPFGRSDAEIGLAAQGEYGFGHYGQHLCYAPWLHAFVSHTGDVFACCMTREKMTPLGNVLQESLREIFHGARYQEFRRQMKETRLAVCSRCDQYLRENRLVDSRLAEQSAPANHPALPILEGVS